MLHPDDVVAVLPGVTGGNVPRGLPGLSADRATADDPVDFEVYGAGLGGPSPRRRRRGHHSCTTPPSSQSGSASGSLRGLAEGRLVRRHICDGQAWQRARHHGGQGLLGGVGGSLPPHTGLALGLVCPHDSHV